MRKLIVRSSSPSTASFRPPEAPTKIATCGFAHGGWTRAYWHDDIGRRFGALMKDSTRSCSGRRTYVDPRRRLRADAGRRPLRRHDERAGEVRRLEDAAGAPVAQHDDHPRRRRRRRPRAEGAARQEHPDRRQQPAGAHAAGARPGRRAASSALSAVAGHRQTPVSRPWRPRNSSCSTRSPTRAASSACTTRASAGDPGDDRSRSAPPCGCACSTAPCPPRCWPTRPRAAWDRHRDPEGAAPPRRAPCRPRP